MAPKRPRVIAISAFFRVPEVQLVDITSLVEEFGIISLNLRERANLWLKPLTGSTVLKKYSNKLRILRTLQKLVRVVFLVATAPRQLFYARYDYKRDRNQRLFFELVKAPGG